MRLQQDGALKTYYPLSEEGRREYEGVVQQPREQRLNGDRPSRVSQVWVMPGGEI